MLDPLAGRRPLPPPFEWRELPAPAGGRPSQPQRFYVEQLATMKERELKCLYVNFEHVAEFDQVGGGGPVAAAAGSGGGRAAVAVRPRAPALAAALCAPPLPCQVPHACLRRCCRPAPRRARAAARRRSPPHQHAVARGSMAADRRARSCVPCPLPQSLAQNIAEAYYRLEPFLRAAVRSFVRQHLDTFAENEDGSDKHVRGGGRQRGWWSKRGLHADTCSGRPGSRAGAAAASVWARRSARHAWLCVRRCAALRLPCPLPALLTPACLPCLSLPCFQFWISFYGLPDNDKLRSLRSNKIGKLSQVRQGDSEARQRALEH